MGGTRRTKADPPRGEARRWSARAAAVLLGLLTAAPAAAGPASEQPGATGKPAAIEAIAARLEQKNGRARLIFETSAAVAATAFAVADPPRIVVDLPEIAFRIDPGVGQGAASRRHEPAGLVRSFRFGQFAPGRSRIVVDLARPAAIVRAESEGSQNAPRLVIELEATDEARFAAAAARARPAAPVETAAPPARPDDKPVLVIDPGHGGVDVGATGAHGEQEKTIVLDFARALKAKLEATGRLRVVLTREDDVFVALDERVRAARGAGAELFLSIHADTLGETSVEGATVYTVSARASDAAAAKTAEKENLADRAAGLAAAPEEEAAGLGDILYDLARRETRAYSRVFARTLIAYWRTFGHLNKNPDRSAGFVVLKAFDTPSALLELGYLSSEHDLARLTSAEWRERAADSTAQAIDRYFAERGAPKTEPAQEVAASARPQ
ncbi:MULTISPECIES: N-acetylmuramoyl-L-alanine amidase [Methylosinus]|uniref:N-acetylmuramoyl-L-alanine amidase n=1 Tax=Methylosinus trichosporium (strain ATCC 35070 / NCIMB 11131 / UNIQEM 75 / OB3b) TaxID=595536 RepID=A0A2D2D0G4_METT3|nr:MULTISPECIES: N-acetylmuramoyl-L-alanine amidase [Methylosinus]ATQ68480.1 N-acetylmuramoyl-L-alanine amidase [Methylosinus trichosporium OB3b]OBS53987.1 N-acetylmuramoyl-L-alanine amidase [Methylosinus sp. 3S-1]